MKYVSVDGNRRVQPLQRLDGDQSHDRLLILQQGKVTHDQCRQRGIPARQLRQRVQERRCAADRRHVLNSEVTMAQKSVSGAGHAVLKWVAGIAASVITGVLVWQLTDGTGPPAPTPPAPTRENDSTPAPPAAVCHVDGAVYVRETNQPLAGIEVHYLRFNPNTGTNEGRRRLATTAPDGRFSMDCSSIEAEYFPLQLELVGPHLRMPHQTSESVRQGEIRHDVFIYVPDQLRK